MVAHPHSPRRSLAPGPAAVLTVAELFERLGEDAVAILKGGRRPTPHAAPEIPGQCPGAAAHVLGRPRGAWELVPPGDPRPGVRRAAVAAGAVLAAGAVFGAASLEDLIEPRSLGGGVVPDAPEDAAAPPEAPQERYGLPFDDVRASGGPAAPQAGAVATGPGIAALGLDGGTAGTERGTAIGAGGDAAGRAVDAAPGGGRTTAGDGGPGDTGASNEVGGVRVAMSGPTLSGRPMTGTPRTLRVASAGTAPVEVDGAVVGGGAVVGSGAPRHRLDEPDSVVPPTGAVAFRATAPTQPLDSASESLRTGAAGTSATPERALRRVVTVSDPAPRENEPQSPEDRGTPPPAAPAATDDRPDPVTERVAEPLPVADGGGSGDGGTPAGQPTTGAGGGRDEAEQPLAEIDAVTATPLIADGDAAAGEEPADGAGPQDAIATTSDEVGQAPGRATGDAPAPTGDAVDDGTPADSTGGDTATGGTATENTAAPGEASSDDTAAVDTAGGDTAAGDTAAGDTAAGDTAAGDTAAEDTAAEDTGSDAVTGGTTGGDLGLSTGTVVAQAPGTAPGDDPNGAGTDPGDTGTGSTEGTGEPRSEDATTEPGTGGSTGSDGAGSTPDPGTGGTDATGSDQDPGTDTGSEPQSGSTGTDAGTGTDTEPGAGTDTEPASDTEPEPESGPTGTDSSGTDGDGTDGDGTVASAGDAEPDETVAG